MSGFPHFELEDISTSDSSSDGSICHNDNAECYLVVKCDSVEALTEQDIVLGRCDCLAVSHLRNRPTLPCNPDNRDEPIVHEDLPVRLPLYHCPFKGCDNQWDSRSAFEKHVLKDGVDSMQGESQKSHRRDIDRICGTDFSWISRLDYVYGAVAVKERERWPDAGFAVARRSLRHVAARYNDQTIQCIVCFVCGSQQTTVDNFDSNDERKPIQYVGRAFFEQAENSCPGTLLNNCSYDLWKARYVDAGLQEEDNSDQQLT